ncbi:thioredoxin family protein [Pleionea sp. CnH1-48]|uniref:thioredoxin family protein n=1 Tax=Pleionea sp. CnH1-48 TaxID=2954494 RepID=UPI0020968C50|nr:thioredoxin family protein [Pleionea sp. CnH1-48]MCO7225248.1 thioredoxin family protein [Pleionea sp. CnH1-48]
MAKLQTPRCEFGLQAPNFILPGVDDKQWTLEQCRGATGILVMFISNHCPYVKAIRQQLVSDVKALRAMGLGVVAINANDSQQYPEESLPFMRSIAQQHNFNFPYLQDTDQKIAKAFGAVCTPDFFGFNAMMELQYRGRLDSSDLESPDQETPRELVLAMRQIAITGQGPKQQNPGTGCSIKWKKEGADLSQWMTA